MIWKQTSPNVIKLQVFSTRRGCRKKIFKLGRVCRDRWDLEKSRHHQIPWKKTQIQQKQKEWKQNALIVEAFIPILKYHEADNGGYKNTTFMVAFGFHVFLFVTCLGSATLTGIENLYLLCRNTPRLASFFIWNLLYCIFWIYDERYLLCCQY